MKPENITPSQDLVSYVKNIMVFKHEQNDTKTILPFYADGYPGIMFQNASKGVYLNPGCKKLSNFFLYGQTIYPIELCIEGRFKIIIYQLYPLSTKYLFDLDPKGLNDDCYDLNLLQGCPTGEIINRLNKSEQTGKQLDIISGFLNRLIKLNKYKTDERIQLAINLILKSKGTIAIKDLRKKIHITERTLERQFAAQTGITPKQFAKIVQFHASHKQLTENDCERLTDIAFETGFADQSHFIRMFKTFTGTTPAYFRKENLK